MTDQAANSTPTPAAETAAQAGEFNFETWLAEQPEAVQGGLTAHLDGLTRALQSERDARKALEKTAKDAEKTHQAAEIAALTDQQKWQELAARHEARVKELEAETAGLPELRTQADRYRQTITARLEAERKGLPDHLIALLDKLDPLDQLDYLSANAPALRAKAAPPPPTPQSYGNGQASEVELRRRAYRSSL